MLEKFLNIFRIRDLRNRIGFTLGMLAIYRLGGHIPTPGINADMVAQFFNQNSGSALPESSLPANPKAGQSAKSTGCLSDFATQGGRGLGTE